MNYNPLLTQIKTHYNEEDTQFDTNLQKFVVKVLDGICKLVQTNNSGKMIDIPAIEERLKLRNNSALCKQLVTNGREAIVLMKFVHSFYPKAVAFIGRPPRDLQKTTESIKTRLPVLNLDLLQGEMKLSDKKTAVYMSAILETVAWEIVELMMRDAPETGMSTKYLLNRVNDDKELKAFLAGIELSAKSPTKR